MREDLGVAIAELRRDDVLAITRARIEAGEDPFDILSACRRGMTRVGDRFQSGDYFLSELLLAAEIFKEVVAHLEPHLLRARAPEPRGRVVLATLRGDIHDLGKDVLATLLRAHGFEVHDLGVDVEPARLVARVREIRPGFVGFSALITVAFDSMREAAELLERDGLRDGLKLMIGGGVTTPAVREYVGADFQSTEATQGVAYCVKGAAGA